MSVSLLVMASALLCPPRFGPSEHGRGRSRAMDQRGEGVISTGIAVLIMAALGALMWAGFQELWVNASTQTAEQISQIGR